MSWFINLFFSHFDTFVMGCCLCLSWYYDSYLFLNTCFVLSTYACLLNVIKTYVTETIILHEV